MSERLIYVTHDYPPEANAMMQALYSRDPQSVFAHIKKVEEIGSEKFMASYYVGYGHKSIGDCGSTTIFVEQVSMLAAKAIQDHPLYSGQEASTRYLDMSLQTMVNPIATDEAGSIQDDWMQLYRDILGVLLEELPRQFPIAVGENEKVYEKAIRAKAFDIARAWLPAGTTTLLSWHTNLRQAYDHLRELRYSPLAEVRAISDEVSIELQQKYPSSFSHKRYEESELYLEKSISTMLYREVSSDQDFVFESHLRIPDDGYIREILSNRPAYTELPKEFRLFGDISTEFYLDFGSYRDLQRHRSATIPLPLLSLDHGFESWYIDMLPASIQSSTMDRMAELEDRIRALSVDPAEKQYYIPLGYRCRIVASFSLPSLVYTAELRSSQTVHPTLRRVSQELIRALTFAHPDVMLHGDMSDDAWTIKRGIQDINKK